MSSKKNWKNSFIVFILKNALIAVIALLLIVLGTLFFIDKYTRHGQTEIVPDLRGLYVEEAEVLLQRQGLFVEVVDSVYSSEKPLGSIVEQTPIPNSKVKRDRPIYLMINSKSVLQIPVPDVTDISYRQADAMIKAIGLKVGNVEYVPSEFKNLVIAVKHNGNIIDQGTRIPEGSSITLVVGYGLDQDRQSVVPAVRGLSLDLAKERIVAGSFIVGSIEYDKPPKGNETEYVVYRQRPPVGATLPIGSRVDLWLSTDLSLLQKNFDDNIFNQPQSDDDEEFF